jgi:hypothetical protein
MAVIVLCFEQQMSLVRGRESERVSCKCEEIMTTCLFGVGGGGTCG